MIERTEKRIHHTFLKLALAACAAFSASAHAQAFPAGPMKLIYPFPAGSAIDSVSRTLAAEAEKALGQPMVVENRPGAAGRLGVAALAQTPGNGHNLSIVVNNVLVVLPLADPNFKYQEGKDYELVTIAAEAYGVMIGRQGLPYKDIRGLIAYAKANPGKVNFASSGVGSAGHLTIELLKAVTGINVTHVPYKGEGPVITDMIAGSVDLMFTQGSAKPFVDSGKIVALATTGPRRWSLFPDLPTMGESGAPGVEYGVWVGVAAPGGTPKDVIAKLNAAFRAAVQNPATKEKFSKLGIESVGSSPEEFSARIRADKARWGPIVKAAGIKFD